MLVACSITWLLVTIRPAWPSITTPEPTAWISRSIGPEGMSKNWRKKGSLNSGFCCIATLPVMAMLTTAGAARRTTGARVGSACSGWRGRRTTRAARRVSNGAGAGSGGAGAARRARQGEGGRAGEGSAGRLVAADVRLYRQGFRRRPPALVQDAGCAERDLAARRRCDRRGQGCREARVRRHALLLCRVLQGAERARAGGAADVRDRLRHRRDQRRRGHADAGADDHAPSCTFRYWFAR